ncbi:MAG: HK97 gp10 family phage protein [Pseudoruegeria sp.]
MKTSFKVEGFKEMEVAMMDLPKAAAKGVVRRVLKKAAALIAAAMGSRAPRDKGDLAESYVVGTKLNKRQRRSSRKKSAIEVYAGTNDSGGVQTEFGNDHQAAQPHARPGWNASKFDALDLIKSEMWGEIAKTVARHQRRLAKKVLR